MCGVARCVLRVCGVVGVWWRVCGVVGMCGVIGVLKNLWCNWCGMESVV